MSRESSLVTVPAGFFEDILQFCVPGLPTSGIGAAFSAWVERRERQAREILLEELQSRKVTPSEAAEQDELIGVLFRYLQVSMEAAAKRNVEMLAQMVAGLAAQRRLSLAAFDRHASLLAHLTDEQITVLAAIYRMAIAGEETYPGHEKQRGVDVKVLRATLVPGNIESVHRLTAICSQLGSTGLLLVSTGFEPPVYMPTILLQEIMQMTSLPETGYS